MSYKTYAKCIAMTVMLSLAGLNLSPALANTTDSGATVKIKVDDLRQVTIYTEALEAENTTLKQSLESERTAVEEMVKAQEEERKAQAVYAETLNNELKKQKIKSTVKNCLLVALSGALIAVIATR